MDFLPFKPFQVNDLEGFFLNEFKWTDAFV